MAFVFFCSKHYTIMQEEAPTMKKTLSILLAIVLMAGVRERLETAKIAVPLKGFPISLVIAGLMSIAFLGFSNMFAGVM